MPDDTATMTVELARSSPWTKAWGSTLHEGGRAVAAGSVTKVPDYT